MNKIIHITTEYLTPSRTIEVFNLLRFEKNKQVYVYNFEGKHFRVFENLVDVIHFFEMGKEPSISFNEEEDLEEFLDQMPVGDCKKLLNLKLNYLYRDGANYKQFGSVIFANPDFLTPRKASEHLRDKLISKEFFVPQDWELPRLQYYPYDPEIDHDYHEFESFEWSDEIPTDERYIQNFLKKIEYHE